MTGWMGTLTKIMTLTLIKFPLCAISNFHNNSQNKHLHSAEEGSEVRGSSVTCPKWGKLLIWNSDVSYSSSKTVLTIQHLSLSLSLSLSHSLTTVIHNSLLELWVFIAKLLLFPPNSFKYFYCITYCTVDSNRVV